MKLEITITPENKEKVFRLISEILEDSEGSVSVPDTLNSSSSALPHRPRTDLLRIPDRGMPRLSGEVFHSDDGSRVRHVGPWIQFNSFYPVIAALRVLCNMQERDGVEETRLSEFVQTCEKLFWQRGLRKLRGFPSTKKDSAIGRFVWHFITTAHEMGLIQVTRTSLSSEEAKEGIPRSSLGWDKVWIAPTAEGQSLAALPNEILDNKVEPQRRNQVLSPEEKSWLLDYLRGVQDEFGLYPLLRDSYEYLNEGHDGKEELPRMIFDHPNFNSYIQENVQKEGEDLIRVKNDYAGILAGSLLALLREFGVVSSRRGDYTVMGEL